MKIAIKLIATLLIITVMASMVGVFASAATLAYGAANVNTPSLRLRSGPGTSHSVVALLSADDVIVILERTNREWFHVNFQGQTGYVNAPLLANIRTAANFDANGRVTGNSVNVRARPNTSSAIVGTTSEGAVLPVVGINNGWYKVRQNGNLGYIRSDLMEIVSNPRPPAAPVRVTAVSPAPPANLDVGQSIVAFSLSYLGHRYVYGGASPSGFDCSGFVSYVFSNHGISLTRNASGQFRDNGVQINRSDLAPGDLVFFSSNGGRSVTHVGIYIGDGEFIHSSRTGLGVIISNLNTSYYRGVWHGAKRVL